MRRQFPKEVRGAFPRSTDEYIQPVERRLKRRRAAVDAEWQELDEGWEANSERMVILKVGPRTYEDNVIDLNVGGSKITVFWHLLAETQVFNNSVLGALLEGVWGDKRIPRDADGRIVLDECPTCMKYLIAQTTLRADSRTGAVAVGLPEILADSEVGIDEASRLIYTAHVMGLQAYVPTNAIYLKLNGGSTTLEPFEIAPLGAKLREWIGGSTDEMTLLYRATRDGYGHEAFIARCTKDSPKTVSLIRVSPGEGNDDDDSIVGGYSVTPWSGRVVTWSERKHMFMFILKDGSATRKDASKPTKWSFNYAYKGGLYALNRSDGPYFGTGGLTTICDRASGSCTVQTENDGCFSAISSPSFLALNGKKVVDIEVYGCSTPAPPETTTSIATKPGGGVLTDAETHDIQSFGGSIARSLMEERVVLDRAVKEMEAAGARVSAAVRALETVYGPIVAAGEQDTVVELNVRGTRMTTLRSTLQACPRSALATMFDEEKWPAIDKDKDEHGRRLVDCSPTCFSRILDVLRMRKRASWSRGVTGNKREGTRGKCSGEICIKEADAEPFRAAVNMYFPGCESFVMDLVQSV